MNQILSIGGRGGFTKNIDFVAKNIDFTLATVYPCKRYIYLAKLKILLIDATRRSNYKDY
jgi:hypothetical protein